MIGFNFLGGSVHSFLQRRKRGSPPHKRLQNLAKGVTEAAHPITMDELEGGLWSALKKLRS